MDEPKQHEPMSFFIPCAKCGRTAALRECAVAISALGLGEITIYLCRKDYEELIETQRTNQTASNEFEQKAAQFQELRNEVVACGLRLQRGQWPSREILRNDLEWSEQAYREARKAYKIVADGTNEGKQARLRVLRFAGLCLYLAICIEAVSAGDSAVSGTLFRVTGAFFKKGGLTIPEKKITRQHVITAMEALLRYRESLLPATTEGHEEEELAAINHAMAAGES